MDSESDNVSDIDSSDDEDYIPGDEIESEGSDYEEEEEDTKRKSSRIRNKSETRTYPKRKGGIRLQKDDNDDEDDDESENDGSENEDKFETLDEIKRQNAEEKEKARVASLWEDFKSDTTQSKPKENTKKQEGSDKARENISLEEKSKSTETTTAQKMVKPTLVKKKEVTNATYSFAGEDVIVLSKSSISNEKSTAEAATKPDEAKTTKPGPSKRSGLGALLGSISKKPKISTLQKTKLDWDYYKEDEGLDDELKSAKDSGYLDRQDFLQRADERQFNIEKETRLTKRVRR